MIDSKDRWFATVENSTLCRGEGNGPHAVTQIMPLVKYIEDGMSFLDVGCGGGTTIDAIAQLKKWVDYKGVDFIDHRIAWLKEKYIGYKFEVQDARHLQEEDKSWDIVWSRHLVDHLGNFEEAMDEQCRVAKKKVICILWVPLNLTEEHNIKPIKDGEKVYEDEWTNSFSKEKVMQYLKKKEQERWQLVTFEENVTYNGSMDSRGRDTVIVLQRV